MATTAIYKRYNGEVWEEIIFPYAHTHTFDSLANKPNSLSGYGITDAHITNGLITIGSNSIRPITSLAGYAKLTDIPSLTGYATEDWVIKRGYITGITNEMITNALGFTPTTNEGTVTSVKMTVPTGLSVSGSPITTSGTLAISLASGYSIPTTAKQKEWDEAVSWGDHSKEGYKKTDTNTTYEFTSGTNGFGVKDSDGNTYTISVTPSIGTASSTQNGLMTTTYVSRLNTMWNVWSADSDNSLVNKVEEVLKVFENFPEADNLATLLAGKQSLDSDLTAIAGLSDTGKGFLKKTGSGTWELDTNTYLGINGTALLAKGLTSVSIGSGVQPVYFNASGVPVACTYTLNKSVPSNAKFTDTTYESKDAASGGTAVSLVTTGEKYTWNNKANTSVATSSADGLMSSSDFTKLSGIATGATKVTSDTVSGWGYTKNIGTVTSVKVGSSSYTPTSGLISLPAYPTSLKNPNAINLKVNSETSNFISYDGSAATTITIKPSTTNGAFIISDGTTNKTIQLAGKFTDTNTQYSAGDGISLSGTTFSNSGVRSVTQDSSNGHKLTFNVGGVNNVITIPDNNTNYYHTPSYSSGLSIASGTGREALYVPIATSSALGVVKFGYTTSGKNYKVQVDSSGNAYVNVPWSDTTANQKITLSGDATGSGTTSIVVTIPEATIDNKGLMSALDKTNLNTLVELLKNDDSNTTVDTIREVLDVFSAYPEGTTIANSLATKASKSSLEALESSVEDLGTQVSTNTSEISDLAASIPSIINNLTSTSTTAALSAAQGKALNDKFANYLPLSGGTLTGGLTITDGKALKFNTINAPTSSGGTTYGAGTNGQVLKSNGTTVYWANDSNSTTVRQYPTSTNAAYPVLFAYESSMTPSTYDTKYTRKSSKITFNPSTGVLGVDGTINATTLQEGGTSLASKYLGISSTAADSSKLNGQAASYYLNYNNLSNKPTIPSAVTVTNNLTSTSTTAALSAAQGKVLNDKFADYQPKGDYITPTTGSEYYPKYIQTRNQPKTGWYGTQYPLYAWWETNNICKLTVDNYSTKVDMATKDASGNVITSTYATKSEIPTSLPASDVYSWAKASSKPSYIADEIVCDDGLSVEEQFGGLPAIYETKANAIVGLRVSGTTITYTKGNGTEGTITTTDTNTRRAIQVNGTQILSSTSTTALNLKAGSNVTISNSGGAVTISASSIDIDDITGDDIYCTSVSEYYEGVTIDEAIGGLHNRILTLENPSSGSGGGGYGEGDSPTFTDLTVTDDATIDDLYCNYVNDMNGNYVTTASLVECVKSYNNGELGGSASLPTEPSFDRVTTSYLTVNTSAYFSSYTSVNFAGNLAIKGIDIDEYILDVVACLMEGTLVTMADGSSKRIEEVKEGDLLMSYDFETGKKTTTVCLGTRIGDFKPYYYCLMFDNGFRIKTNWTHDIYNATKGTWTNTDQELELDDEVLTENNGKAKFIGRLEAIGTPNGRKVHFYDIMTSNNCYYADGVLFSHTPTKQAGWVSRHIEDAPTELIDLITSYKNETHRETDLMQKDEYVNQYLDTMHSMLMKESKLRELKDNLSRTDYITLKVSEGIEITDTMQEILDSRKMWRKEFNEVEAELSNVYKTANDLKVKYSDIGEDVLLDSMGLRKKFFLESCKKGNANLNKFKEYYKNSDKFEVNY